MSDFLYAELRRDVEGVIRLTEGLTTDTAVTTVDNDNKTVKVDVLGCPGTFTIQLNDDGTEKVEFDGSIDVLWNFYNTISQYVKIADIVDSLNSDASNLPLSANQGRILKGLVDAAVSTVSFNADALVNDIPSNCLLYSDIGSECYIVHKWVGMNDYVGIEIMYPGGYWYKWGKIRNSTLASIMIDENKTIFPNKTYVDGQLALKQDNLTFDSAPTQNSTNPVTSGGLFTTLQNYVLKTRTIAGLDLTSDISVAALSGALFTIVDVTIDDPDEQAE